MSFIVETDEGTWELPDSLRGVVTSFFKALEVSSGADVVKFHPNGMGHMAEMVIPKITNLGFKKIHIIKEIRAAYGIGLKEAKEKTDENTPIRCGPLPMFKAIEFQKACQEAGATVELPNALDRLARI
jgi:ribosomal protein L7/L12